MGIFCRYIIISINLLTERTLPVCLVNAHVYKYVNLPYVCYKSTRIRFSETLFIFFAMIYHMGQQMILIAKLKHHLGTSFLDLLFFFCLVFAMPSCASV